MSRIGEQLKSLRRPAAALGFGFAAATVPKRRMLLLVRLDQLPDAAHVGSALGRADVVVVVPGEGDCSAILALAAEQCPSVPLGICVEKGSSLPEAASAACCDFCLCDVEGPLEVLGQKDKGCLIRVDAGIEPSRLRATAELGIDALVLDSESLDLSRLSSVVECRRTHTVSGKPVVLQVRGVLEASSIAILWRAGVDALLVDSSLGADMIEATRSALDSAPYESRALSSGSGAVIGAHIGALGVADAHEDGGGGEEEEEDDDDD